MESHSIDEAGRPWVTPPLAWVSKRPQPPPGRPPPGRRLRRGFTVQQQQEAWGRFPKTTGFPPSAACGGAEVGGRNPSLPQGLRVAPPIAQEACSEGKSCPRGQNLTDPGWGRREDPDKGVYPGESWPWHQSRAPHVNWLKTVRNRPSSTERARVQFHGGIKQDI